VKGLDMRDIALVVVVAGVDYVGAAAVDVNFRMDIETGYLLQAQMAVEAYLLGIEPECLRKIGRGQAVCIADPPRIIKMMEYWMASSWG
jgi:hypothetical protein